MFVQYSILILISSGKHVESGSFKSFALVLSRDAGLMAVEIFFYHTYCMYLFAFSYLFLSKIFLCFDYKCIM